MSSPVYGPSLSLRLLESEQYGRRSFTSIMLLLVLLENIQSCCCSATQTERLTDRQTDSEKDAEISEGDRDRQRDRLLDSTCKQRERDRQTETVSKIVMSYAVTL